MQKDMRPKADPDRLPPMGSNHHTHYDEAMGEPMFDTGLHLLNLEEFIKAHDTGVQPAETPQPDQVNRPSHYTSHPSGVECIAITEHYDFCVGNAIKYLWRCGLKVEEGMAPKDKEIEDLKKAVYYITRKINNLEK